jgi:hypothetical protein
MPSSLPPSVHEGRCHADPRCPRTRCFQAGLCKTLGQVKPDRTVDTCADHLGDIVQALVQWANSNGFGGGYLTVSVIGPGRPGTGGEGPPLSSFPFATISLETWKPDNDASFVAAARTPAARTPAARTPVVGTPAVRSPAARNSAGPGRGVWAHPPIPLLSVRFAH